MGECNCKTWGVVTAISPAVQVRFAGDSTDVTLALGNDAYTPTVNDKVALDKLGSTGGWCIAYKIGTL